LASLLALFEANSRRFWKVLKRRRNTVENKGTALLMLLWEVLGEGGNAQ
jgi:hypothetical protein